MEKPLSGRGLLSIAERAAHELNRQQLLDRCGVEMQHAPAIVSVTVVSVAVLSVAVVSAAEVQTHPTPLPAAAPTSTLIWSAASRVACSCAAAANSRQPQRRTKAAAAAELEAAAAAAAVVAASCGAAAVFATHTATSATSLATSATSPAISSRTKKRRGLVGVGVVQCSQPRQPASSRSDSGKRGSRHAAAAALKHNGSSLVVLPPSRLSAPTPTARLPPPPHAAAGEGAAARTSAARVARPASKARTLEQPRAEVEAPPPGRSWKVLGDPGTSLSASRLEVVSGGGGANTAQHSATSSSSSLPRVRHSTPRCSPPSARPEERAVSAPLLAAGAAGEAGGALSAAARTTRHLPAPAAVPTWKSASHERSSSPERGGVASVGVGLGLGPGPGRRARTSGSRPRARAKG